MANRSAHDEAQQRVVIAGSMNAFRSMTDLAESLRAAGIEAVIPIPEDHAAIDSQDRWRAFKKDASRRHIAEIRDGRTAALLVANVDRGEYSDYIGANTFAEIAIAFADERPVYLLQGMPAQYADELDAWGARCLHGDLRPLFNALTESHGHLV